MCPGGVLEGAILDLRVGSECLWGWDCFQAFVVLDLGTFPLSVVECRGYPRQFD